ncbi:MAG: CoA transferase [Dehalococcoidia bacterium]|nr:CoA transferase [Dehalococcoidia bacterium]
MAGAFDGIRIIDFTQGIAGPMATMLLAGQGAEVIKVEPPGGDRMKDHPGYLAWNVNKQRLVLDLHRYEGLSATRSLLATADVAVFDCAPGELERLGLDAATVRAANPAIIHAWLPPYSPAGRWSQLPPDDVLLEALGTISAAQSSYEDRPVYLVSPQASYGHGMLAAGAIAAALVERTKTGAGESLVVSGLNGVAAVHSGINIKWADVMDRHTGSSRGAVPNYRLYQCADGQWLFLGTLTPAFFLRALEAMDLMDLITLEGIQGDFTKMLMPPMNAVAIEWLDRRFAEKPRDEWLDILREAGVPRGPAGERNEWFRSETVAINEMCLEFEHPQLGKVLVPGVPVKLSATPGKAVHLLADAKRESLAGHRPVLPASPSQGPDPRGPLAGIRVLDLGQFIAGTFAPTFLASYGADVIKVEMLDGDPFRLAGLQFAAHNRGKRGIAIDLKSDAGRETFYDLVRVSDVVLDNWRLGVRERLGLTYPALRAINPRIISCSVTGYGPVGPLANDPGFDPLLQARSGLMNAQGGDDEPVFFKVAVNDSASALVSAFGVLAALFARERTGEGQEVLTCLANQSILTQSGEVTWYEGRPEPPTGGRDFLGISALNRLYQCTDGWIALACHQPEQFHQVAAGLGHTEWAGRVTAERALDDAPGGTLAGLIAEALSGMSRSEALDRLLVRGVPVAPAITVPEFFESPWAAENRYFDTYEHPQFGPTTGPRAYASFGGRGGFSRGAPLLGGSTVEVLREYGIDEGRVEKLLAEGVIRQA